MVIIVTGGRFFNDIEMVDRTLDSVHAADNITMLIEGGASGADDLCRLWAMRYQVPYKTIRADWKNHGRAAGPIRNCEMLNHNPKMLVAFPGGPGTTECIRQATERGILVYRPAEE